MFVDESFACFLFLWVKRIHLSDLWNERELGVNGMVIWSMGRENVMGLLKEHIFEVRTPIGDLLIGNLSSLGQLGG